MIYRYKVCYIGTKQVSWPFHFTHVVRKIFIILFNFEIALFDIKVDKMMKIFELSQVIPLSFVTQFTISGPLEALNLKQDLKKIVRHLKCEIFHFLFRKRRPTREMRLLGRLRPIFCKIFEPKLLTLDSCFVSSGKSQKTGFYFDKTAVNSSFWG